MEPIELLNTVALSHDRPDLSLRRGQVGAVVEAYPPDEFEVEFVDQNGQTYGLHLLKRDELILLHYQPARVAG